MNTLLHIHRRSRRSTISGVIPIWWSSSTSSSLSYRVPSSYVAKASTTDTLSRNVRSFSALTTTTSSHSNGYEFCQFTASCPSPDCTAIGRNDRLLQHQHLLLTQHQQQRVHVRFRRHDRASAFSKPRPKTKKQRQAHNRRMKRLNDEEARWNAPGSKAGPRRQWAKDRWNQLLETAASSEGSDSLALPGGSIDRNNPYQLSGSNAVALHSSLESGDDEEGDDDEYSLEDALLEDMIWNTSHVTSQPTPEPVYLGHKHKKYYNRVANKMDMYREALVVVEEQSKQVQHQQQQPVPSSNGSSLIDTSSMTELLPTDHDISLVLRAYRDRHGSRKNPIGIVAALKHLLQDLGVPTTSFDEMTFTALLTCCKTPKEGRRIFQLIRENGHDVSAYAWSILVDIYARNGDYEGCAAALKEMADKGGHAPTMAAYTSLLAACYKVCSDHGRVPHAVRAHAGNVGWQHWQDMIIVGIEPDAMAYGAILRLCAARGHPERAISLLEDMQRFQVKPTTLCFTAALKAVAKSHETSIRFENGSSRKQLRRETIAAHHGKMARSIVVMAEQAEVEQDDGFVSALMLCAAAAGDSATTKAVYLASEVRKMNQLQSIASPQLTANKMYDRPELVIDESTESDAAKLEAESGSVSVDSSSTLIAETSSTSLPASGHKKNRSVALVPYGEREYGKDTRTLSALMHASSQAMNKNGMGTIWAGRENQGYLCDNSLRLITTRWEPSYRNTQIPGTDSTKVGIGALKRLDDIERETGPQPGKRKKFRGLYVDDDDILTIDDIDVDDDPTSIDGFVYGNEPDDHDDEDDFFGPSTEDTGFVTSDSTLPITKTHKPVKERGDSTYSDEEVFAKFVAEMKEEAAKNGEEFDLNDEEARELFQMTMAEFMDDEIHSSQAEEKGGMVPEDFDSFLAEIKQEAKDRGQAFDYDEAEVREFFDLMRANNDHIDDPDEDMDESSNLDSDESSGVGTIQTEFMDDNKMLSLLPSTLSSEQIPAPLVAESGINPKLAGLSRSQIAKVEELQTALPGLPIGRAKRIVQAFEGTLGAPSLLALVPHLRESMPDYVTSGWLKRTNLLNAEIAMSKAVEDGLVDISLLNAMLEAKCSSGSIDEALAYHQEFAAHGVKPNAYSDRLVVQMLLDCNRQSRALKFKEDVESDGRTLDLASYGSFIQYFSRRNRLGPALMLLNECLSVHGSQPSEFYLSQLRVLCRQNDVEEEVRLKYLVGEDPIAWLKHGERFLKREKSKKGNRDTHRAYNRALA